MLKISTLPAYAAEVLAQFLTSAWGKIEFWDVSIPKFLEEGTEVADFAVPDRVLICGDAGVVEHQTAPCGQLAPAGISFTANLRGSMLSNLTTNLFVDDRTSSISGVVGSGRGP